MEKCKKCSGVGYIETLEKTTECECSILKRLASSMPAYIRAAKVEKEHVNLPFIRRARENLMVHAFWEDMKAIVKVVMYLNIDRYIKITTDLEIKNVGVGGMSRVSRGEEGGEVYNTIQDLVDSPSLLIIHLNQLGYKNKAASGFLEEAINSRIDRNKPIWLVSDKHKPFGPHAYSYSQSIIDLINSTFRKVDVPSISSASMRHMIESRSVIEEPRIFELENKRENQKVLPAAVSVDKSVFFQEKSVDEAPISIIGSGNKKKAFGRSYTKESDDSEANDLIAKYGSGNKKKR